MMLNYLKAEMYQLTHRRAVRNWFIFLMVMPFLIHLLVKLGIIFFTDNDVPGLIVKSNLYNNSIGSSIYIIVLSILYSTGSMYIVGALVDFSFNNEHRNRTFINTVSYSYSRAQIYVTKWLSAFILCFTSLAVFVGVFTIATSFFYSISWELIWNQVIVKTFTIPMLYYVMSLSLFLAISINLHANMGYIFLGLGVINLIDKLMVNLIVSKYESISPYLFFNLYETNMDSNNFQRYIIFGIAYILIFNLIGYMLFKRKEIK